MKLANIEAIVGKALAGGINQPIAWPNRAFKPNGSYVEFRHAPNTVEDPVISGGYEYEIGIFLITAVTPAGGFAGEAACIAECIKDCFPKALRLGGVDGNVVINAPPKFGTPFQDGAYWRQPVSIQYITE